MNSTKLKTFGNIVTGKTPPTKETRYFSNDSSDYPFITPTDMGYDSKYIDTERFLTDYAEKDFSNYKLPKNTICYVCIGNTIGKICITKRESFTNQQINSVMLKNDDDLEYLYYLLRNNYYKIKQVAGGAATPIINKSQFSELEFVSHDDTLIRKKIGKVLSLYDFLIENNNKRIKVLEEMAQALYNEWFVNFRFPGHEKVKMVDSELGKIPEGWAVKKISDLTDLIRGYSYSGKELSDEGGALFFSLKCIERGGGFRTDGLKRIAPLKKCKSIVNPEDILIAITDMTQNRAIVGQAMRVPNNVLYKDAVYSMDLVKLDNYKISKNYIYSYLKYSSYKEKIKQYANGANVLHLNPQHIEDSAIVVPSINTLDTFSELVTPLFTLKDTLEQKNNFLSLNRDLLIPKLISGELDVSELDI